MGSLCGTSTTHDRVNHNSHAVRTVPIVQNTIHTERVREIERDDHQEKFKDFEEFSNGRLIGEGIKQIPAYKCSLNDNELNKLREDFWVSRKGNRLVWDCLSTICKADAATAFELMKAAQLKCVGGNLRCVLDPRNPEHLFKIPNFCIEDPVFEKDFSAKQQNENKILEKSIKVIIDNFLRMDKIELTVSNKINGLDLKRIYAEKLNLTLDKVKIRFIFRGKEIQNDHGLYLHDIDNNAKIHVSVNEI